MNTELVRDALQHAAMSIHHPECTKAMRRGRPCSCHVDKAKAALAGMVAPEVRPPEPSTRTATFVGQAWINNHAMEVDDGRTTFGISDSEYVEAGGDKALDYDELKDAARAPDWVRDWQGPFEIYVSPRNPSPETRP